MDFHPYGWATGPWELITQSPEQGGGCRCPPKLLHRLWFSLHQLRSCPPQQIAWRLFLSLSASFPFPLPPAGEAAAAIGADIAWCSGPHTLHSPTAGGVRRPASGSPLPLLSSSHSSPKSQALKNENRMWGCLQTKLRRTATIPFALAAGAGKHVC
jgi:hypothetical protein